MAISWDDARRELTAVMEEADADRQLARLTKLESEMAAAVPAPETPATDMMALRNNAVVCRQLLTVDALPLDPSFGPMLSAIAHAFQGRMWSLELLEELGQRCGELAAEANGAAMEVARLEAAVSKQEKDFRLLQSLREVMETLVGTAANKAED